MRIYYIGKFKEEHNTENYVTAAFEELGHKVYQYKHNKKETLAQIFNRIQEFGADTVLFSKAEFPEAKKLIDLCYAKGILTVCWQFDLFIGYRSKLPEQFWSDFLFTTDGGHQREFIKLRCNHRLLRQGIHKPEAIKIDSTEYKYDVAFVGSCTHVSHESRRNLLKFLQQRKSFIHYQTMRGLKLNEALNQVKIVVGDSYPSPNYWSNRIYEITGRGGFFLHPFTEGLDSEFEDGEHYVGYQRGNYKQLCDRIDLLLREDSARERIRQAGFEKTRNCYTYTHRVQELLSIIS